MADQRRSMSLRTSVLGDKTRKKGNGWKGSYRDRMDIPKEDYTPILLCPGKYEDLRPESMKENGGEPPIKHYHTHPSHTFKDGDVFRKDRCAAGWDGKDGDCLWCVRKSQGDKRISVARATNSMNVLHFDIFAKTPAKDKDGKIRRYDQDNDEYGQKRGDPIMNWERVTRARDKKEILQNLDEKLAEGDVKLFRKAYVEAGSNHLQNLMNIDDLARRHCRCGGALTPVKFLCAKCNEVLMDVEEENLDVKEQLAYGSERQRCTACHTFDFPEMEHQCDECDTPTPLSAFEVVAWIRRTGEGTASQITIEKIVPIYSFELPDGSYLLEVEEDGSAFKTDDEGNFVFREDIAKLVNNQFDFDKVHQPRPNDDIAKLCRCENPFGSGGGARSYGRGKAAETEEVEEEAEEETVRKPSPPKPRPGVRK